MAGVDAAGRARAVHVMTQAGFDKEISGRHVRLGLTLAGRTTGSWPATQPYATGKGPATLPTTITRSILQASLAVARVQNDDQGNTRLAKREHGGNSARDDVAAALTLAAGAVSRLPAVSRGAYLGSVG